MNFFGLITITTAGNTNIFIVSSIGSNKKAGFAARLLSIGNIEYYKCA